jgi:hypothetical protein
VAISNLDFLSSIETGVYPAKRAVKDTDPE